MAYSIAAERRDSFLLNAGPSTRYVRSSRLYYVYIYSLYWCCSSSVSLLIGLFVSLYASTFFFSFFRSWGATFRLLYIYISYICIYIEQNSFLLSPPREPQPRKFACSNCIMERAQLSVARVSDGGGGAGTRTLLVSNLESLSDALARSAIIISIRATFGWRWRRLYSIYGRPILLIIAIVYLCNVESLQLILYIYILIYKYRTIIVFRSQIHCRLIARINHAHDA